MNNYIALKIASTILSTVFFSINGITSAQASSFDFQDKLLAPDGAARDLFGYSVGMSGNTTIVGAILDNDNGTVSGSAYLYDTTTGNLLTKLLPPDGAAYDNFGQSVAISGNTAIVGAQGNDDNGLNSGSAYLFDITTGNLLTKLLAPDGAAGDLFGRSVRISGNTAIVGAHLDDDNGTDSGSVYLFDTTNGNLLTKLLAPDGAPGDAFGWSVAISGNTAIVGARWDDDNGTDSGSAYLFDTTTGNLLTKLLPPDGAAGDVFGSNIGISGNTAIVGAPLDDDNGENNSGSAYLFDTTTGNLLTKLLAPDGAAGDVFGVSVGISGNTAIIGAMFDDDNGTDSGSAYLFEDSKPVPEPFTILGTVTALGFGAMFKRKNTKKETE